MLTLTYIRYLAYFKMTFYNMCGLHKHTDDAVGSGCSETVELVQDFSHFYKINNKH